MPDKESQAILPTQQLSGSALREAKVVISRYHEYLSENSLIESVFDEALSLPPPKKLQKVQEKSEA
jgi:hypothetical protein